MSIIKACLVGASIKNTGKECDSAMGPTAMLIAAPRTLEIDAADLADPDAWITPLLHAAAGSRIYPIFGEAAPINNINNNNESDTIITLDDGTQVFVRYGIYNRTFQTIAGGLCYAQALASLLRSGYGILELDQSGQILLAKKSAGIWRPLFSSFMYSPSPILADLKTNVYQNRYSYSFSPTELVNNGEIFTGAQSLLSVMGLIDSMFTPGLTTQTTTNIYVGVQTECAGSNLIALFPVGLAHASNVIVKNKATGNVISISAAAIIGGELRLTGTFVSGQTYTVIGTAPSAWLANSIEGYDGSTGTAADVVIP